MIESIYGTKVRTFTQEERDLKAKNLEIMMNAANEESRQRDLIEAKRAEIESLINSGRRVDVCNGMGVIANCSLAYVPKSVLLGRPGTQIIVR